VFTFLAFNPTIFVMALLTTSSSASAGFGLFAIFRHSLPDRGDADPGDDLPVHHHRVAVTNSILGDGNKSAKSSSPTSP
jgi:hypothetical protein